MSHIGGPSRVLLTFLFAASCPAQINTGRISGFIHDSVGASVRVSPRGASQSTQSVIKRPFFPSRERTVRITQ